MEIDDMQSKLLSALAVAGAIGGVVGLIVGIIAGAPLPQVGALAGAIISFPLGGYVVKRQRRWLCMTLLYGLFVGTFFELGGIAAGVAIFASFLTFSIAAGIVKCWYGNSDWNALKSHFRIAIGLNHGFQIVDEGKITLPKNLNIVLGPRNLFIKPYNAVILERGAKQTRILGPERCATKPFEYVKYIFDLREVTNNLLIDRVATQAPINVDIHLSATYGIDIREAVRLEGKEINDDEKKALRQLSMRSGDWKEATRSAIKSSVRQIMCRQHIDQLLSPKGFTRLESQILNLTNHRLRPWHVSVSNVLIESIEAPPEFD
ncbi:MAG: hypothetical protein GXP37_05965, partial [Chloroflexi bacterium]|nr:hypothetical protein [Chloroflexota bacterium]